MAQACIDIALMYTNAQLVGQDLSLAKEFFGKACDLRNSNGCESYKVLNLQGVKDPVKSQNNEVTPKKGAKK